MLLFVRNSVRKTWEDSEGLNFSYLRNRYFIDSCYEFAVPIPIIYKTAVEEAPPSNESGEIKDERITFSFLGLRLHRGKKFYFQTEAHS